MIENAARVGVYGAIAALVGAILSGPVAVTVVAVTHPQPPWQGAGTFAASYHPIQLLPYAFGFVLVTGFILVMATLHALAEPRHRALTTTALVLTAAFASFVFLNYVLQTTVVPELARDVTANAALVSALSLSNPRSLGWALEMWGYGFLGGATWLVAPVLGRHRAAEWAFIANGPISILGAVWTVLRPGWELGGAGLVLFAVWNVLVVVMAALAIPAFRDHGLTPLSRPHTRSRPARA